MIIAGQSYNVINPLMHNNNFSQCTGWCWEKGILLKLLAHSSLVEYTGQLILVLKVQWHKGTQR